MREVVVDASVAVKWFFEEEDSDAADDLIRSDVALIAPSLIVSDILGIGAEKISGGHADEAGVRAAIAELTDRIVRLIPVERLADRTLEISILYGIGIPDALYLAPALNKDRIVMTADRRFRQRMVVAGLGSLVHLLADGPARP